MVFVQRSFGGKRVAGAAEENARAAGADLHVAATLVAFDVRVRRFVRRMPPSALLRHRELAGEITVELVEHWSLPLGITLGDLVELTFHLRREAVVEQVFELLDQPLSHQLADLARRGSACSAG